MQVCRGRAPWQRTTAVVQCISMLRVSARSGITARVDSTRDILGLV
jgi:hypothetical protein